MTEFIKYELSTGKIVLSGNCPDYGLSYQEQEGYGIIADVDGDSSNNHVVSGGVLTKNPQLVTVSKTTLAADGLDSVVFENITNPSSCKIQSPVDAVAVDTFLISDGVLTFKTYVAGTYVITIDFFPYLPFIQNITAS